MNGNDMMPSTSQDMNRGICMYWVTGTVCVYGCTPSYSGASEEAADVRRESPFSWGPGILMFCSLSGGDNTDRRDKKEWSDAAIGVALLKHSWPWLTNCFRSMAIGGLSKVIGTIPKTCFFSPGANSCMQHR